VFIGVEPRRADIRRADCTECADSAVGFPTYTSDGERVPTGGHIVFSFTKRKQRVEIAAYLRRICDGTAPNNGLTDRLERTENRYNRTLPAVVWLWQDDKPTAADKFDVCVTKDITDHGVGLILTTPLANREVVVCLRSSDRADAEPWFFLGRVVRGKAIGGGFWITGVELVELLNRDRPGIIEDLRPHAERMLAFCG
jgi:hypothetical protein